MTFFQFIQAHYVAIGLMAALCFKTAVNALPPAGQPFQFSQWFMGWMRDLSQEAPKSFPNLTPAQAKILTDAGHPIVPTAPTA